MQDTVRAKVKRGSAWRAPLALVAVFIVVMMVLSFGYRVRTIRVVNASEYTDVEIIEASGISRGDNIFFVDRFSAASLIFSNLKYMDAVSITRELPGTIVIQAEGSAPAAYFQLSGEYWLMARNGKVLGSVSALEAEKYPEVRGFTSVSAYPGEMLAASETDAARLAYACELIRCAQAESMTGDILWMDFSDVSNPVFRYQGRISVRLGEMDSTGFKLASFRKALDLLSPDDKGALTYAEGSLWNYAPD